MGDLPDHQVSHSDLIVAPALEALNCQEQPSLDATPAPATIIIDQEQHPLPQPYPAGQLIVIVDPFSRPELRPGPNEIIVFHSEDGLHPYSTTCQNCQHDNLKEH